MMMYLPKVSIIMPVYNSEKYLHIAIDSVIEQVFTEWELILINDGSIDNSGKICNEYATKDKRIKVFHKDNGGACSARNVGIEESKGEYITFIDNDDIYSDALLEVMMNNILHSGSDIIKCGRVNIFKNSDDIEIRRENRYYSSNVLSQNEFSYQYINIRNSGILSSVWNGLYRRNIIIDNHIRFDENVIHGNEDIIFNSLYLKYCKKVEIISDLLYYHYIRCSHSTSAKYYPDQIETRIIAIEKEKELINNQEGAVKILYIKGALECFSLLDNSQCILKEKKQLDIIYNFINNKNIALKDVIKYRCKFRINDLIKSIFIFSNLIVLYYFIKKIYNKLK